MQRFSGKVALVTGAASGIGAAAARRLAREGALVVVTDLDGEGAAEVAREVDADALAFRLDVRDEQDWEAAAERLRAAGRPLDVLVNNAGITGFVEGLGPQDPELCTLETWRAVHATNLEGVFLGCRMAIRFMGRRGGSIVNVSSRSGVVGVPLACAYASSKAAVRNHTRSVALYCAARRYPIRCNAVHPGPVLTAMWEQMLGKDSGRTERLREFSADVPLGRFGQPEEIAAAIAYAASDDASYMTGSELHLDGGLLAGSAVAPQPQS